MITSDRASRDSHTKNITITMSRDNRTSAREVYSSASRTTYFSLLALGQVPAPGRQPGSQASSALFRVKLRSGTSCNSFPVSDSASGYETPLPLTCQILLGTRIRTFSTQQGPEQILTLDTVLSFIHP